MPIKAQSVKEAKKQEKRIVIKENHSLVTHNPNYKQNNPSNRVSGNLSINTNRDSILKDDNYKHRPHNKACNVITIKEEPVDKKDENYKHQFPSGN